MHTTGLVHKGDSILSQDLDPTCLAPRQLLLTHDILIWRMVCQYIELLSNQVLSPPLDCQDATQHLTLRCTVLTFRVIESFRKILNGIPQFTMFLLKDSTHSYLGSICLHPNWQFRVIHLQHRCGNQTLLQILEGFHLHFGKQQRRGLSP